MADLARAKKVKERYEDRLRRLPDVVGVGLGGGPEDAKIIVLAKRITPELQRSVPKALDGVPVEILESGVIQPR